jgi:hypothetical protein
MSTTTTRTGNGQLTKNFHISEFKCKDGTHVPAELIPNTQLLADNLQVLRDDLNTNRPAAAPKGVEIGISVNSGYRTPEYNKKVGGKKNSYHPKAMAGDLTCKWETPTQLAARIERLIKEKKMKQGGIGIYPGFTHYDPRGVKARW